jgi:hypothetical protein
MWIFKNICYTVMHLHLFYGMPCTLDMTNAPLTPSARDG